jgi:hypothetical protein
MPRPKSNKESDRVRRMVHQHLAGRGSLASTARAAAGAHLDEDALSVFVEGRLSEREAAPLIRHLVACASCRHITTQLIRLDTELAAADAPAHAPPEEEPGRIRRLLADLAARVLPASEGDVVFAYHAPADDFEQKDEAEGGEEKKENE